MDSLISRQAAVEYLMTNMGWHDEDGYEVDDADEKRTIIEDLINGIPSVPAVPLDKLCELMAETNVVVPCKICEHCDTDDCEIFPCPSTAEGWRNALTKWMEGKYAAG